MSDDPTLPRRLRNMGLAPCDEAADRIEALEAELQSLGKIIDEWVDRYHEAAEDHAHTLAALAAERALADQLADALDRTLHALRLVLSGKPCRDVAETEGEALRALAAHRAARTPQETE